MYMIHRNPQSFSLDVLDLLRLVDEVVSVGPGNESALIGLLHKVFVSLLLGEQDSILLGLEVQVGALHAIGRGLPAHQGVLPAMSPLQDIPIHSPVVGAPGSGLCGGLRLAVDPRRYDQRADGEVYLNEASYRTVRACRSVGAPERTAAATVAPGSLPSMTRLGTGENCLSRCQ